MQHFDIVIIGGGFVGAASALALANPSVKIAVVDATALHRHDARLFALSDHSCALLQRLQLWSTLMPHATAIRDIHVSYQRHFGALRLKHSKNLGYVIPAAVVEAALQEALQAQTAVTLYRPAQLIALMQNHDQCHLTIKSDAGTLLLTANTVIAADGTQSTVRALLGIETTTKDYGQIALVTRTQLARSHAHIAYERFLADGGAIAMLPLLQDECATIWTGPHAKISTLLSLSDQDFIAQLQAHFGYRLGRLLRVGMRHHYPLTFVYASDSVKGNVILIGNAAHTLHPIAAQGLNLALHEVEMLAKGLSKGQSLATIHQTMQPQIKASLKASDGIARLFEGKSRVLSHLLPLGIVGLDLVTPLKRRVLSKLS